MTDDIDTRLTLLRERQEHAVIEQTEIAREYRAIAWTLKATGLNQAQIGVRMGVSRQRVVQLLARAR